MTLPNLTSTVMCKKNLKDMYVTYPTHLQTVQLMPSIISIAMSFISVSDSLSSDLRLRDELSDFSEGVGDGVWDLKALGESRRGLLAPSPSSSRICS